MIFVPHDHGNPSSPSDTQQILGVDFSVHERVECQKFIQSKERRFQSNCVRYHSVETSLLLIHGAVGWFSENLFRFLFRHHSIISTVILTAIISS